MDEDLPFSGFSAKEQEIRYNQTLFDLVTTLATRVTAVLCSSEFNSKTDHFLESAHQFRASAIDVKVGKNLTRLINRLR